MVSTLRSVERISTAEAARRLGVSQTQVRRQVKAGTLRAETESRPQGTRLVILWDAPADTPFTEHDTPSVATNDATLTVRLEDEVRWLRERLERAEEERGELRRMLNLEQQTVAGLRAQLAEPRTEAAPLDTTRTPPPTLQDAPLTTLPANAPGTAATPPARRPWWRRLLGQ